MERTGYEPTDDEAERIERAGMAAALAELQPLDADDIQVSAGVLACLRAFKAASNACISATRELLATKPGYEYVLHYSEVTDMVCSAMGALLFGLEASECSPRSIVGGRISIFFSGGESA